MTFILVGLQFAQVLGFFSLFAIGTFGFTVGELFMVFAILYMAIQTIWFGRPLRIPTSLEMLALGALLGAFALSTLVVGLGGDKPVIIQAAKTFSHVAMLWVAAVAIICYPITAKQWVVALRWNMAIAAVVCLYAVYQLPARMLDWPLAWITITNASFGRGELDGAVTEQLALQFADFFRATSLFSEPSGLATYAASTLLILVVPMLRSGRSIITSKVLTWSLVVLLLLSMLLAFSLTGVMILGVCGLATALLFHKQVIKRLFITAVAAVAVLGVGNILVYQLTNFDVLETFALRIRGVVSGEASKMQSGDIIVGKSYDQRESDYLVSAAVWEKNPIVGVGPGCFSISEDGKNHSEPFVSSTYASVAAELGSVGLIALAALHAFMLFGCVKDYLQWNVIAEEQGTYRELLVPFLPMKVLQLIVISFTANTLISPTMFSDFALVLGIQQHTRRELQEKAEKEIYFVRIPLRTRVIMWLRKGARVGTDY